MVFIALATATACDVDPKATAVQSGSGSSPVLASAASVESGVAPSVHASFPTGACRQGFRQAGPRLCISEVVQQFYPYRRAVRHCRDLRSEVCTYEDLSYLYGRTNLDAVYNPNGSWLGNMVGNNEVLCGNRDITSDDDPDTVDFEGVCSKNDSHPFWCCHDDE